MSNDRPKCKLRYKLQIWYYCIRGRYSLVTAEYMEYLLSDRGFPQHQKNTYLWAIQYIRKYFKEVDDA